MMPPPTFRFFLGGTKKPVYPGDALWESPLPMDRHHFQHSERDCADHKGFTHGDYFTVAHRFLAKELPRVVSAISDSRPTEPISDIHICLMKHGEFYHPSRIDVLLNGHHRSFVLNVAVSDSGLRAIDTEFSALKRLGEISEPSFVPNVHVKGRVAVNGDFTADMFLGEWFDGFHEFHLSRNPADGSQMICVWGEKDEPCLLSSDESYLLYHQATKILSIYFNVATTEHISQWHHAAGDFVVHHKRDRLSVKLITVRRYTPLLRMDEVIRGSGKSRDRAMGALLLFFLTLSVRMRLDRLDGIGDPVWADDTAVIGVWTGFLEGLRNSYFPFSPNPVARFESYLSGYSTADLLDLAEVLLPVLPISPAEKRVVEMHIGRHMEVLCDTIGRLGFQ